MATDPEPEINLYDQAEDGMFGEVSIGFNPGGVIPMFETYGRYGVVRIEMNDDDARRLADYIEANPAPGLLGTELANLAKDLRMARLRTDMSHGR